MFDNIFSNNGWNIALSGILVVFAGLVLIATVIYLFNLYFAWRCRQRPVPGETPCNQGMRPARTRLRDIPEDELVAISVAVEFYHRIHFDMLQSEITFERGNAYSGWKLGSRYGQRGN